MQTSSGDREKIRTSRILALTQLVHDISCERPAAPASRVVSAAATPAARAGRGRLSRFSTTNAHRPPAASDNISVQGNNQFWLLYFAGDFAAQARMTTRIMSFWSFAGTFRILTRPSPHSIFTTAWPVISRPRRCVQQIDCGYMHVPQAAFRRGKRHLRAQEYTNDARHRGLHRQARNTCTPATIRDREAFDQRRARAREYM